MSEYNFMIVCFIFMIGFVIVIKAEWVEIPQFSHNKKIYRASLKFDHLNQFYDDKREEFTSIVHYGTQNVSKLKKVLKTSNTLNQNRSDDLLVIDSTISSLDFSGYSQGTTATVTSSKNISLDENEESFGNYYYNEYNDEKEAHNKQINTSEISDLGEQLFYSTCATNILETKMLPNSSEYRDKGNINISKMETNRHFLYYLPIKLLRRVHLILKAQPSTLKGKVRFLKNFEKTLLTEVESQLAASIFPFSYVNVSKSNRKRRHDHHEDDSLGFPSLEGALMAISFLTFAVYLVRLIMLLFQNFNNNPATAATVFLGRKKRSMDYLNEDMIRILGYLNK